jgi:hypothetical protein
VKDEVQMKDYFIELVAHIDSSFRTLPDRTRRGVMGFSMGGYMSFVLAGKYPDKICAAVDMTGSSEFFIGYPSNHTLYQLQYTFENLREVRLRMHNNDDFISMLNTQVYKSALWQGVPVEYWHFPGEHRVDDPGKTDAFEKAMKFIVAAFNDPIAVPQTWSHYDLYSQFDIWNYRVTTDKHEPGFIYLRNTSKNGFGIYTRKWLPLGPPIKELSGEVITAPVYAEGTDFNIVKFKEGKVKEIKMKSDEKGRLHFYNDLNDCEFGISSKGGKPDFISVGYNFDGNKKLLRVGKENKLSIKILNRGAAVTTNKKVRVVLTPLDSTVTVMNKSVGIDWKKSQRIITSPSFVLRCSKTPPPRLEPPYVRFKINVRLENNEFEDELVVPVFFNVPVFKNVQIDDGVKVRDSVYGRGNGNGAASPAEEIMVYIDGKRARLFTDDPYVLAKEERLIDEILPGTAGDGYTLSSVISIAANCPAGHVIECLANFETKTKSGVVPIDRKLTWGKVLIKINK